MSSWPRIVSNAARSSPARGGARLGDLDAAVGERRRSAAHGVAAGAADGLQAVLLEDAERLGGRGLEPRSAITLNTRSRSAAERARGPRPPNICGPAERGQRVRGTGRGPRRARRAGRRRRSRRRARGSSRRGRCRSRAGLMAAAIAAASPPEEPPAVRVGSCGLRGRPVDAVDGVPERAELRQVGLAEQDRAGAPHAADHDGVVAARRARRAGGSRSSHGSPATSMTSLAVNGTPCSGPSGSPRASAASAAAASTRAASRRGTTIALTRRCAPRCARRAPRAARPR